jgi:C4-dicarboxylate-specific signal transduction histidine kinase
MDPPLRILHLEDDATDSALVQETLEGGGLRCELTRVDTQAAFCERLEQGELDLILADYTLPSFDGFSALQLAKERRPEVPFLFVSGTLDEQVAIESLKVGATDYVFKTKMSRIVPSVRRALREAEERSRRAEAERALRATQAELAHLARVMTMGEMAASIAHEVNQPLSAIVLNGKACLRWLSRESPDLGEACAAVERIIGDATRAGDVIARVRGLTRKAATHKARLDLNETIEQVVVLARAELHKHGVALRMELRRDLAPVLGDRVQLQQVLLNLFLNAIEAMSAAAGRPRELVVATAEHDATQALVSVRDTGAGLDPQLRDRVFDAFYTTKPGGMGMGLAICRSIVQDHGGRLWAEMNDGPGATFRFTLPKAS